MGTFDWVDYEAPCPRCGAAITCWQTKCGPCDCYAHVKPAEVDQFSGYCDTCGAVVEATVTAERVNTLVDIKLEVSGTSAYWLHEKQREGGDGE